MALPEREHRREELWADLEELLHQLLETESKDDVFSQFSASARGFSYKRLRKLRRKLRARMKVSPTHPRQPETQQALASWVLRLLTGKESLTTLREAVGEVHDLQALYRAVRNGRFKQRNKALVVLAHLKGAPSRLISRVLRLSRNTVG